MCLRSWQRYHRRITAIVITISHVDTVVFFQMRYEVEFILIRVVLVEINATGSDGCGCARYSYIQIDSAQTTK